MTQALRIGTGPDGILRAVLDGAWDPAFGQRLRRQGVAELELNYAHGWDGTSLEFLKDLEWLEGLVIIHPRVTDDSAVHSLRMLRSLNLSTYSKMPIDFHCFPNLSRCVFYWRAGSESLFACEQLEDLFLHGYDGSVSKPFMTMRSLCRLAIANSAIQEIASVRYLKDLRHLRLLNLRYLRSLDGLQYLRDLAELEVSGCAGITTIDEVGSLTSLTKLYLNDDRTIASLSPIRGLDLLEEVMFYGGTKIADGDLSPLQSLPRLKRVSFQNRRHYSHRREDFPSAA